MSTTITRPSHDAGAVVLWDLSHSVGSVPLSTGRVGCRPGGRLHLQVPERRSGFAGLRVRPTRASGRVPAADLGLDGSPGRVRDGSGLRAGRRHPAAAERHAAGLGMLAVQDSLDLIGDGRHGRRSGTKSISSPSSPIGSLPRVAGAARRASWPRPLDPAAARLARHAGAPGFPRADRRLCGRRRDPRLPFSTRASARSQPTQHVLRRGAGGAHRDQPRARSADRQRAPAPPERRRPSRGRPG